jgi:hypothetical protein
MGLGATANVIGTEKSLVIVWDTGVLEGNKPVLSRQTLKVDSAITPQEAYDAAYNIASLTDYTISNIYLVTQEILSPID